MNTEKCIMQAYVYEDGVGWRENESGICSALTRSFIGVMLAEGRCGTTRCPFFKPAKYGGPEEVIRHEDGRGRVTFERRMYDVLL